METTAESIAGARRAAGPRWEALAERVRELRESADSEWSALSEAFDGPGTDSLRKWLGWALYRLARRVNPEVGAD